MENNQIPQWIQIAGGRKLVAYFASLLCTTGLALFGCASSEILFAVQGALGLFVGGNAAEHKYKGPSGSKNRTRESELTE